MMLYRLVCGPELEEIWSYINTHGPDVTRSEIGHWFTQQTVASASNLEEALIVLRTLRLVSGRDVYTATPVPYPFRLAVLRQMRSFATGCDAGEHVLDSWYMRLVDMLFISPDITYLGDLHRQANRLNPPMPLNDEKLNAWRRVMEWLGVGRRVGSGFAAVYTPQVIATLLETWGCKEGPLDEFTQHVERFLPCVAEHNDLALALILPLTWLNKAGKVVLSYRQDAPYKTFGGAERVNWILMKG